ncbi:receptor-like protein 7 [Mangifera indica]|uniref:receptor-like protein 7 n=1 Tax=Mangifera indica TaxID=29780 RepID=UPI001CF9932D|nr:receptor-like protein 7 [Mangifera indica]XP_044483535.1 receptor-like protein 7 [Mangifera indica]
MMSWKEDKDCCLWDGVTCDSLTGHVIDIDLSCARLHGSFPSNTSLFLLNHLQRLNLAYNDFNLSHISLDFHRLSSLTHLNLSCSNFFGQIPSEITHLSKLIVLDVSQNYEFSIETNTLKGLVQNLTKLAVLHLDYVNMSTVVPSCLMNLSFSLCFLSLSSCELQGNFPNSIFHLPSLKTLNLAYNYNLTSVLPMFNWSSPLEFLDVSSTAFSGELPSSLGNLKYLTHFDASDCDLYGVLPVSLGNLSNLNHLSLSSNNFGGQVPNMILNMSHLFDLDFSLNQLTGPIPSHVNTFGTLVYISLYSNSFNGSLPSWLFTLPSLQFVDLSFNELTGTINEFHSKSLESLYLDGNRLHGSVPSSMFELINLTTLVLSLDNSSAIDLHLFSKLKKLRELDFSRVNLSLSTSFKGNFSFLQLTTLRLSACNLREFPDILRKLDQLRWLDLSENRIHGRIPKWMWNIGKESLHWLNLSYNFLTTLDHIPWKNLQYLDLRSNSIQAPFPIAPPYLKFLSLSNNNLTGEIPQLCNMSILQVVDLSNNNLNGTIPECMVNSSSLHVLDVQKNRLHGDIPRAFATGNNLKTLNFNGNGLEGPIPQSLVNCSRLEVLDLGNNNINDSFPYWLGDLPKLQVLVLRFNNFYGSDWGSSKFNSGFSVLRILDLSHNNFNGYLSVRFFENLKAMMNLDEEKKKLNYMGDSYYQDSLEMVVKGFGIHLEKILTTFTTIDFSNNCFHGEIPSSIGKLHSLRLLNLSQNSLTGHIPSSLGDLIALEALDLSSNKLVGVIPRELVSLTFLAKLNLSKNQLVGPIPQANQFNTFENDSYIGNPGLCGFMLSKKCNIDEATQPQSSIFHGEKLKISGWCEWKFVMMGYGCGLPLGLFIGYQVLTTGKLQWLLRMINKGTKRCERTRRRNKKTKQKLVSS